MCVWERHSQGPLNFSDLRPPPPLAALLPRASPLSFGKAFDVTFQSSDGKVSPVYGSSWGVSTRMVGAVIMSHSDDDGLVLPPRVAEVQVVVVPIAAKKGEAEKQAKLDEAVKNIVDGLRSKGVRVKVRDARGL